MVANSIRGHRYRPCVQHRAPPMPVARAASRSFTLLNTCPPVQSRAMFRQCQVIQPTIQPICRRSIRQCHPPQQVSHDESAVSHEYADDRCAHPLHCREASHKARDCDVTEESASVTVAPASTAHTHLLPCQPKSVRDGICVDPPLGAARNET